MQLVQRAMGALARSFDVAAPESGDVGGRPPTPRGSRRGTTAACSARRRCRGTPSGPSRSAWPSTPRATRSAVFEVGLSRVSYEQVDPRDGRGPGASRRRRVDVAAAAKGASERHPRSPPACAPSALASRLRPGGARDARRAAPACCPSRPDRQRRGRVDRLRLRTRHGRRRAVARDRCRHIGPRRSGPGAREHRRHDRGRVRQPARHRAARPARRSLLRPRRPRSARCRRASRARTALSSGGPGDAVCVAGATRSYATKRQA